MTLTAVTIVDAQQGRDGVGAPASEAEVQFTSEEQRQHAPHAVTLDKIRMVGLDE